MPAGEFDIFDRDRFYAAPPDFEAREWQGACLGHFSKLAASSAPLPDQPTVFTVYAGVGSGKTYLAALIASHCLNMDLVSRVVYVSPNRAIASGVRRAFHSFGLDIAHWDNEKHKDGEGSKFSGCAMTYQSLARRPGWQLDIVRRRRTLVIFDEIHHLGDRQAWGDAAELAFRPARFVVGLTGTPFRSDGARIPFMRYVVGADGLSRIVADPPHGYSYPLGEAIADGWCREPIFTLLNGDVEIKPDPDGPASVVDFNSDVSTETQNLRLAGAVRHGSRARTEAIRTVLDACFGSSPRRKLIIFLGGDSNSDTSAIEDATVHLPAELVGLGVSPEKIVSVTSCDKAAIQKIRAFGKSDAEILISINMVSEGVDIPELSAALFLTNITAVTTTIQRIGRVLRKTSRNDPIEHSLIFFFRDPRYVKFTTEIKQEIRNYEIRAASNREAAGRERPRQPRRASSIGLNAYVDGMTFNGKVYTQDQVNFVRDDIRRRGIAASSFTLGYALEVTFGDALTSREARS